MCVLHAHLDAANDHIAELEAKLAEIVQLPDRIVRGDTWADTYDFREGYYRTLQKVKAIIGGES